MSYPGNASLAEETRQKILSTFRQTLDLARDGRAQEAVLGCDFILKMDPLFEPARQLQSRLDAGGDVVLDDLEVVFQPTAPPPAPPAPAQEPAPDSGDLDLNLDVDLPPLQESDLPLESVDGDDLAADAYLSNQQTMQAPPTPPPAEQPAAAPATPPPVDEEFSSLQDAFDVDPNEGVTSSAGADELPSLDLGGSASAPAAAPTPASAPGNGRIEELLGEGQAAFEEGNFQTAIDAWSRIFLIDIDHHEANSRIELARKLKAEQERQVDELFHEAMGYRDQGQLEEAKAALAKVLELQPGHLAAKDQLEQIDRGEAPAPPPPPMPPPDAADGLGGPEAAAEALGGFPDEEGDELYGELPDMPDLGLDDADMPAAPPTSAPRSSSKRTFGIVGVLVLVLLAVGAWQVVSRWDQLFPNSSESAAEAPAPPDAERPARQSIIAQANDLAFEGQKEEAIEKLRQVGSDHPLYGEAQNLIREWTKELEVAADEARPGPSTADLIGRRDQLLDLARGYYSEREYWRAAKAFQAASDIAPLDGSVADLFNDAKQQLLPIRQQIDLFRQQEWDLVLPTLWRLKIDDPENQDVVRLLTDTYYNLGVRELRRGDAQKALAHFAEVDKLGADPSSERMLSFTQTYTQIPRDLLYHVFVDQLSFRR